ncbi:MMPL family transporter [Metabacillus arenae]|uniref:MMPL family transporter n=1 Tax=Metabacillus arenae TaxID=2771434 RepID=A0A926NKK4_9BACI|nr:MMPL family transporter [Metabacillus arenae]MBD1382318.1 MMPL family transporter [Metabacillus arenae]
MNRIIKGKWLVMIAWIAACAGLFFIAPNMADLVKEKGQLEMPDGYSSKLAEQIMENVNEQEKTGAVSQVALVFHSDKKLTEQDYKEAEKAIAKLEANKSELGITEIMTHFNDENLKSELVSQDETTILAAVSIEVGGRDAGELTDLLYKEIEDTKLEHYYSSSWMVDEDLNTNSEEGLKRTEGITLVFILAVLLLVFRSVIAPVIPLITVGFTYLASQSIVSILVDVVNFPISSYTQIFLVVILFGIGTDYCILLLSRFKEEIPKQETLPEAIIETYRTAGKTVFFSGIAVMIGFASIGLSTFKLYQSAAGVAIGVVVLLMALVTIVPFFMAVLGPKIFWPSKGNLEHKDSKFWGSAGRFALRRPLIALLIVAAVAIPVFLTYDGDLSFDSLAEVGDDARSIKAFNIIADSFGPGESMPTQVVIRNDEPMNTSDYLVLSEEISKELSNLNYVDSIRSATRPTGEPIEDLFVSEQLEVVEEGIGEGNNGIKEISEGLNEAGNKLSKSEPELKEATDGISELISGTNEIKTGMTEIQTNLTKIEQGIRQGTAGSNEIIANLEKMKAGAEELLAGNKELLAGYTEIGHNVAAVNNKYQEVGQGLSSLNQALASITPNHFEELEKNNSELLKDPNYLKIKNTVQAVQQQLPALSEGLTQLNAGLDPISKGINQANGSFGKIIEGQRELSNGLSQLIQGIEEQKAGFEKLADGQGQIVNSFPKLTGGLDDVNQGQQQLMDGFGGLGDQMTELTNGLDQSTAGLNEVHDGLGSARHYLSGLTESTNSGIYIPDDVLKDKEFEQALDAFMSKDRKVMTMDVVFEESPYSNEAIGQTEVIKETIERTTKGTKLESADIALGGITSTSADMNAMSQADYSRTVILMLTGIAIVLFIMFRSVIIPLYLIASLILTYYTSMAFAEFIFVNILGHEGIGWAVPFFGFVIIIALGIDYSIFLMDRFNEYKEKTVEEAMLLAMRKMGTVIISAAIILGGTFAAMMPSGVLTLMQIATVTLIGLLLYALLVLPLFIPVMAKTFGQANWWPFKK